MKPYLEVITFKLKAGVSEQDFYAVHEAFRAFLDAQTGLLYRTLAKHPENETFIDIIYWQSKADIAKVEESFYDDARCKALMDIVDSESVVMSQNEIIAQSCNS
ncbi:hypothetical protein NI389_19370 (plasmid) [Pseudoalteromonas xiamenensis]|uniref:hypothetical protein n=1 Tax=Pseudoalteromonas xiamenensis TaxID=882626 RepID=UPI0027E530C4|nr:hypothetical protein [Pseudoalteromonas xiamenensis]WMN61963.1 hypothetical protein NI389_19370 [Pseudoalteromonas xiamenensis]